MDTKVTDLTAVTTAQPMTNKGYAELGWKAYGIHKESMKYSFDIDVPEFADLSWQLRTNWIHVASELVQAERDRQQAEITALRSQVTALTEELKRSQEKTKIALRSSKYNWDGS